MTFEEWLDEHEGFSGARLYRLIDDVNSPDPKYNDRILEWLKAAWEVGYEHRDLQLMDDGK